MVGWEIFALNDCFSIRPLLVKERFCRYMTLFFFFFFFFFSFHELFLVLFPGMKLFLAEIFQQKFTSVSTGRYKLVTLVKMGPADYEMISKIATDFTKKRMIILSNCLFSSTILILESAKTVFEKNAV